MVAYASASRVAAFLVAMIVATSTGMPSAYAARHDQPGVKRLWSQFPLGPQLRPHAAKHAPPPQPPHAPAPTQAQTSAPEDPSGGSGLSWPWWAWPVMAAVGGVIALAIAARSPGAASPSPDLSGVPPPSGNTRRPPVQPVPAGAPPEHPWSSDVPRILETLPRKELLAIANALGVENTVRRSHEELIDLLSPRRSAATSASEGLDRALARYAATYAAACREGNPAPILAVSALVSPATADAAAHSKRMIAEARRRGLLTSAGRGKQGGELTPRGKALLQESASESPPSPDQ
jgi:hypothetical protein